MSQEELKERALSIAYNLTTVLEGIEDVDFVDAILSAVSSNDQIALIDMMY